MTLLSIRTAKQSKAKQNIHTNTNTHNCIYIHILLWSYRCHRYHDVIRTLTRCAMYDITTFCCINRQTSKKIGHTSSHINYQFIATNSQNITQSSAVAALSFSISLSFYLAFFSFGIFTYKITCSSIGLHFNNQSTT